jgi:N-acetylmuramoyl-L-alanine amidase
MFKLALNAGHYLGTPGKRCLKSLDPNETREWYLNDRIADKIQKKLKEYDGIEVLRTDDTEGKVDIALDDRTYQANRWCADFYLSIHHNAGVNGGKGGGIVAIVYDKTKNAETLAWQKALYDSLIKYTGLKGNRAEPLAKMNLHECRETTMPAVLLELGFMDSTTDVPIILTEAFAEKCANAIVEVIVDKVGLHKTMSDIEFVQNKCGFSDSTIDYLCDYTYAVDLFRKLRNAMK